VRILLLGANGQVGFELQRALAPLGPLQVTTRDGRLPGGAECLAADLSVPESLQRVLDECRPEVVINAAAYTAVDRAEDEAELAQAINAAAPAALSQWCARARALLVHYSTDYVFDGQASTPYLEDDATAPLGVYGSSKLAAEAAIRASGARHLIFRTAWVYAARGHNFLRTMLRLGAERDVLRVVADQRGAPTPARWIAAATAAVLARPGVLASAASDLGTFHLTAAGETSWHGFAEALFDDAVRAGRFSAAPRIDAIGTADYPTRARRPAYSRLDNSRLQQRFGLQLPDWRRGVAEVVAEVAP
jgi:dTDP-4-dehydrorhamnose reductase